MCKFYSDKDAMFNGFGCDISFLYQLLDRCIQDCKYFLGAGNRNEKYLYGKTIALHIKLMKQLYKTVPTKPEWTSMKEIEMFEREMTA